MLTSCCCLDGSGHEKPSKVCRSKKNMLEIIPDKYYEMEEVAAVWVLKLFSPCLKQASCELCIAKAAGYHFTWSKKGIRKMEFLDGNEV